MSWWRRLLTHLGHAPVPRRERRRAAKERKVLREADRVIADFRRMDGALRITVEPKR